MVEHEVLVKGDKVLEVSDGKVISEKDYTRVLAGYKATAHRENLPAETRQHAEEMIKALEESYAISNEVKGTPDQGQADEQHRHRVIGGFRAALKNQNVSDEAKEHACQRLKELGVDEEEI